MKKIFLLVSIALRFTATAQTTPMINGTGTKDRVPKFTGTNKIGNSQIIDNGKVGIGTLSPQSKLHVNGTGLFSDTLTITTMNINDSSDRAASTAFIKRKFSGVSFLKNLQSVSDDGNTTTNNIFLQKNYQDISLTVGNEQNKFIAVELAMKNLEPLLIFYNKNVANGTTVSIGSLQESSSPDRRINFPDKSGTVALLTDITDTSKWKITGTNIYNKNIGNVGIGTSTPTSKLHVKGANVFLESDTIKTKIGDIPRFEQLAINASIPIQQNFYGVGLSLDSSYSNSFGAGDYSFNGNKFSWHHIGASPSYYTNLGLESKNLKNLPDTNILQVNPTGAYNWNYETITLKIFESSSATKLHAKGTFTDLYTGTVLSLNNLDTLTYSFNMVAGVPASQGDRFRVIFTALDPNPSTIIIAHPVSYTGSINNVLVMDGDTIKTAAYTTSAGVISTLANATNADFAMQPNTAVYLPSGILTANRFITIPTGLNGYFMEIYNNESVFSWGLMGANVYFSDGISTIKDLAANTNYLIRYIGGKWRILN